MQIREITKNTVIPVSLSVIGLLAWFVYSATTAFNDTRADIRSVSEKLIDHGTRIERLEQDNRAVNDRLTRIEVKLETMGASIDKIEKAVTK